MPLEIPPIDDQNYQEILNNALARVRVHNPEWTNLSPSDPGVTILELFAFMTETLLYRSNRIPERNRRKFLSLLGVPMTPASPARGIVTFANDKGPLQTVALPADMELRAGSVPFRTTGGVDVLPVESRVYYKRRADRQTADTQRPLYARYYASPERAAEEEFYEAAILEPPTDSNRMPLLNLGRQTVDGQLWIALLARPKESVASARRAIANKEVSLGVLPGYDTPQVLLQPGRTPQTFRQSPVIFELATIDPKTRLPVYKSLPTKMYINVLNTPGIARLLLPGPDVLATWDDAENVPGDLYDLPPLLDDDKDASRVVAWIRMRLPDLTSGTRNVKVSWVGINAAEVNQCAQVVAELAGTGTGEPDQALSLVHRNIIPGSVKLTVGGEEWAEIDDLTAAGPEVPVRDPRLPPGMPAPSFRSARVFTLDPESGQIRFGDGARGARPRKDDDIRATYAYGGGREGNVAIGTITKGPTLPPGFKVTNSLPTWGGDEAETVEEAEKQIPTYLKHRDRLVTEDDFRELVLRTPGVEIGRVEVIPLLHPDFSRHSLNAPGAVTMMVIPRAEGTAESGPSPDRLFLDQVREQVDTRRLITTEVIICGPTYVPLNVSIGLEVLAGYDYPTVRDAVNQAIRRFLSPLHGGRDGKGWPRHRAVFKNELLAEADRVEGVAFVYDVLLGREDDDEPSDEVKLNQLELPWLVRVETRRGRPEPLRQDYAGPEGGRKPARPVRRVPQDC